MPSLFGQTYGFFMTILAGGLLGLVFDFYRIFRGVARPNRTLTIVTDLAFWLFVTPLVFGVLLAGNWGSLRFYALMGIGLGAFLYAQLLSRYIVWALMGLWQSLGKFVSATLYGAGMVLKAPFAFQFGRRRSGFANRGISMRPAGLRWQKNARFWRH